MNTYFVLAAALSFLVGLVHSVFGERLVFRRLRRGGLVPTHGGDVLHERHVRILWASWHVLTVLGWCLAAVLLWLARAGAGTGPFIPRAIAVAMLVGAAFVLVGTRAKHPGWLGLLGVAVLVWLGSSP